MAGRVVYDSATASPGHCPTCGKRLDRCPGHGRPASTAAVPRDGVVRLHRDRKHRGGKVVTVITGLPPAQLSSLASELKRLCGTGGTVRDDSVEIQGDHRDRLADVLRQKGFSVKLAGG
jgi:translation initiation factor 1